MLGSFSFSQRTINVWKQIISRVCIHASSVNKIMFKNRIDKYLVKARLHIK